MKRSSRAWKKRGKMRWKWRKKKMRRRIRDQRRQR
jgi:large subunit ribosomal protein L41e